MYYWYTIRDYPILCLLECSYIVVVLCRIYSPPGAAACDESITSTCLWTNILVEDFEWDGERGDCVGHVDNAGDTPLARATPASIYVAYCTTL